MICRAGPGVRWTIAEIKGVREGEREVKSKDVLFLLLDLEIL